MSLHDSRFQRAPRPSRATQQEASAADAAVELIAELRGLADSRAAAAHALGIIPLDE